MESITLWLRHKDIDVDEIHVDMSMRTTELTLMTLIVSKIMMSTIRMLLEKRRWSFTRKKDNNIAEVFNTYKDDDLPNVDKDATLTVDDINVRDIG